MIQIPHHSTLPYHAMEAVTLAAFTQGFDRALQASVLQQAPDSEQEVLHVERLSKKVVRPLFKRFDGLRDGTKSGY